MRVFLLKLPRGFVFGLVSWLCFVLRVAAVRPAQLVAFRSKLTLVNAAMPKNVSLSLSQSRCPALARWLPFISLAWSIH